LWILERLLKYYLEIQFSLSVTIIVLGLHVENIIAYNTLFNPQVII